MSGQIRHRMVHVKVSSGEEAIVPMWETVKVLNNPDVKADIQIPGKLLRDAVWIYDLEHKKIIKNTTSKSFLVPLGVPTVKRDWLIERRYILDRP